MRIIALANQKGGCAKTTTATNLAAALAAADKRVLLVDNDPQGHATLAFGFRERDFSLSTYDLYLTSDILVEDAFLEAGDNLQLVPAGVELSAVEQALAREEDKELRLRNKLRRSAMPFDYVLIDCPPAVGLLTFNALLAAGEVMIPVDPSYYGLQAVRKMRETLTLLRERRGHDAIPHILMADFDTRPRFVRSLMAELEELYEGDLMDTIIHHTVRFKEAAGAGVPLLHYDAESRGAVDFRLLARELLAEEQDVSVTAVDRWATLLHGPRTTEGGLAFEADFPRAKTVRITGSFCDWSAQGIPLERREDGIWSCRLQLDRGDHEYRYIVDGAWLPDPHNEATAPNEFGGANSVCVVP
ncbi:MAG: AAA family ATPase [bacterium]|nr:AAA family ATPase [bacterium]